MSLASGLSSISENFRNKAPQDIQDTIRTAQTTFSASFKPKSAIKVGDNLPEFRLTDAVGKEVSSADLLAQGLLLVTFYRGEWCPFCNLALRALQEHLEEFKAKNVTLVAISPELPNSSLTMVEKHDLKFTVLSDVGNKFARSLGIVWSLPDAMRPIYQDFFKHDLKARNGDDSFEIPIPATFLVDQNGVVRRAFIDTDYTKRLEPATALEWIDELRG